MSARARPYSFIVAVHNEGEPIDSALLPRLFEPMARGTSGPTPARSIGLGLYIVREIARAHGGTVSVESTAGRGTTLTAVLPRQPLPCLKTPRETPSAPR